MSDIFNEIDEELRRERLRQAWERYGIYVIGLALIIILGVGGWRGYQWWEARQAAQAGAIFEQAVALGSEGKNQEAEEAFARIAEGRTAYHVLARLRQASEMAKRDPAAAIKLYEGLAADPSVDQVMQDLARVRAGMILIDTASLEQLASHLEPATGEGRVFRHTARELMAFSAWKGGNAVATKRWHDAIQADPSTPIGVRSRTEMLMALSAPDAGS